MLMMSMKNISVTFLLFILFANDVLSSSDEEYVDSVINMLLNGESIEVQKSEEPSQGTVRYKNIFPSAPTSYHQNIFLENWNSNITKLTG
jgi:hypothetical protein